MNLHRIGKLTACILLLICGPALAQNCPDGRCPLPKAAGQQPRPVQAARPAVQAPAGTLEATALIQYYHSGKVASVDGGTGVIVAKGKNIVNENEEVAILITNRHVAPRPPRQGEVIVASFPHAKEQYAGLWLTVDGRPDLAAILIKAPDIVPVSLADGELPAGAQVYQVGFPGMRGPVTREGQVIGYTGKDKRGADVWTLQLGTDHGDSGSGVFGSNGRLAGIVWGGPTKDHSKTEAVGLSDLRSFVERCERKWLRPSKPAVPAGGKQPGIGVSEGPAPATGAADQAGLRARIEQLEAQAKQAAEAWAKSHDAIRRDFSQLQESLGKVESSQPKLDVDKSLTAFDGELKKAHSGLADVRDGLAKAHAIGDKLDAVAAKLGGLEPVAAEAAKLGGWSTWMPLIAAGASVGGVGAAVPVAMWAGSLILGAMRRRQGQLPNVTAIPAAPLPQIQPADLLRMPGDKQELIIDLLKGLQQARAAPPAQQTASPAATQTVVRKESELVPIPTADPRMEAMHRALEEFARRNPSTGIDIVDTIKSFAAQYESGQRK